MSRRTPKSRKLQTDSYASDEANDRSSREGDGKGDLIAETSPESAENSASPPLSKSRGTKRSAWKRRPTERDEFQADLAQGRPRRRRRRVLTLVAALLVLGMLAVLFAPTLLSVDSVRRAAVRFAVPQLADQLHITRLRCGWTSPIELQGIRLGQVPTGDGDTATGTPGQTVPMIEIPTARWSRTLWQLATNRQDWGTIEVDSAVIRLELRADGSNVEDLVSVLSLPSAPDGGSVGRPTLDTLPRVRLRVANATLLAHDVMHDRSWTVDNLNLEVDAPFESAAGVAALVPAPATADSAGTDELQSDRGPAELANVAFQLKASGAVPSSSPDAMFSVDIQCDALDNQPNMAGATPKAAPSISLGQLLGAHQGRASLRASRLPLDVLQYVANRVGTRLALAGDGSTDCQATWARTGDEFSGSLSADATGQHLQMQSREWLGDDTLRSESLQVTCQISVSPERIEITRATIKSDFGSASVLGSAPLSGAKLGSGPWQHTVRNATLQSEGSLDLAALGQLLPQTLHIRDQVELQSGSITWNINHAPAAQAHDAVTEGVLQASPWQIATDGRPLRVDFPAEIRFAVDHASVEFPLAWTLRNLDLTSPAFRLTAQGNLAQGELRLSSDLRRVAADLSQIVDLGETQIQGQVQASLQWQRDSLKQLVDIRGHSDWHDFQLLTASRPAWREPHLIIDATASVRDPSTVDKPFSELLRVAQLQLTSGTDRLRIELPPAPDNVAGQGNTPHKKDQAATFEQPVEFWSEGSLATWHARLAPFIEIPPGVEVRGDFIAQGKITAQLLTRGGNESMEVVQLDASEVQASLKQLAVRCGDWQIDEPIARLQSSGVYSAKNCSWQSQRTTLSTSTLSLVANDLQLAWSPSVTLQGVVGYRGDLARLQRWITNPRSSTYQLAGQFVGTLRMMHAEGRSDFETAADVSSAALYSLTSRATTANSVTSGLARNRLTAGAASSTGDAAMNSGSNQLVWQEPQVTVRMKGSFGGVDQPLTFDAFQLQMPTMQVAAQGEALAVASGSPEVNLKGEMSFDWSSLETLLQSYLGPDVHITGQQRQTFMVQGPIFPGDARSPRSEQASAARGPFSAASWPASDAASIVSEHRIVDDRLAAKLSLGWQSANVYGLPLSHGEIASQLKDGIVSAGPIELSVGQGRVKLSPQLNLNQPTMLLSAEPGQVIENIELTPELCAKWLKYVAPLLADATSAQGTFSVALADARVPIAQPTFSEIQGTLSIQQARVGAGPLARQFLNVGQQIKDIVRRQVGSSPIINPDKPWMLLPEQQVPFQVTNGRVHHRDLMVQIDDVSIRTQGWVSLIDDRLEMQAEVPVQDAWVAQVPALAAMRGQMLTLPISGTLSRPQLDSRAISQLSGQLIQRAAEGYLKQELNNQLEKQLKRFLQ